MRVHHLNCISECPIGGKWMDGRSRGRLRGELTCHCLLVETDHELVLVDTGFGLRDVAAPRPRLNRFMLALNGPDLREELTAIRQIERLGYDPNDVRHILLTHLDFDHAGGLDDFPQAVVHMMSRERDLALARPTPLDRMRFRPQQWRRQANWRVHDLREGERWFGFDCVRDVDGLPPDILLVPLPGHTLGHAGIAIRRERGWLLHAGDAYFYHREMDPDRRRCTPGLRLYQWMMEKDRKSRLRNLYRLRALRQAHGAEVTIFCAHDAVEFERLARVSPHQPAPSLEGIPIERIPPQETERRTFH